MRQTHLSYAEITELTEKARDLYDNKGRSIREIAQVTRRSYGTIHKLLKEDGVEFYSRGGSLLNRPGRTAASDAWPRSNGSVP